MNDVFAELMGTFLLMLLGNGVVANAILKRTKGAGSGWLLINIGWGMAVFLAVAVVGQFSGAHINPAVTVGLAAAGKFPWGEVPIYIVAQMGGAMLGALTVYGFYYDHYQLTEDGPTKRGTFCTAPEVRNPISNLFSEIIGTFVLVLLYFAQPFLDMGNGNEVKMGLGSLDALPIGLVVFAIGMGLGGTTGYAINPARDLGPRLVYSLTPLTRDADPDWGYAWIPVIGPLLEAALAAGVHLALA